MHAKLFRCCWHDPVQQHVSNTNNTSYKPSLPFLPSLCHVNMPCTLTVTCLGNLPYAFILHCRRFWVWSHQVLQLMCHCSHTPAELTPAAPRVVKAVLPLCSAERGSPFKYWQVAGDTWVVHDSAKVLWLSVALVAFWLLCWRPRS